MSMNREDEFRSLLRDLQEAMRCALPRLEEIESDGSGPMANAQTSENLIDQQLLLWRAICFGSRLADDVASWAIHQGVPPSPFRYPALWIDVPAWYKGQASPVVTNWVRSLDAGQLWALVLANQMAWIYNQMDPVEAYPVINGDLKGSARYPTKETTSDEEWHTLLSPDTLPSVDLSGSVALMRFNADYFIETLLEE